MQLPKIKLDLLKLRERWRKRPEYGCIWSSPDNPIGFKLTPTIEPGRLFVDMRIERNHSGFPGIAQGGVAFTILDGLMSWYIMAHQGRAGVTKECAVRYRRPLLVGKTYRFQVTGGDGDTQAAAGALLKVTGTVHEVGDNGAPSADSLLTMSADFFLPNRETARRILGIELGPEGEELFPND